MLVLQTLCIRFTVEFLVFGRVDFCFDVSYVWWLYGAVLLFEKLSSLLRCVMLQVERHHHLFDPDGDYLSCPDGVVLPTTVVSPEKNTILPIESFHSR